MICHRNTIKLLVQTFVNPLLCSNSSIPKAITCRSMKMKITLLPFCSFKLYHRIKFYFFEIAVFLIYYLCLPPYLHKQNVDLHQFGKITNRNIRQQFITWIIFPAITYKKTLQIIHISTYNNAVPARKTWRRPLMVRQPYSEAVPSTRGRLHPLVPEGREAWKERWSLL